MSTINASGTLYIRDAGVNSIQYSTDGVSYSAVGTWPITISNTAPATTLKVTFVNNLTLASGNFFICGTNNIQFGNDTLNANGTRTVITVNNYANFPGLIQNGDVSNNGKNNITIQNIGLISSGTTTLIASGGWLAQQYFAKGVTGNYILNCYSTGNMTNNSSGGIAGANCGSSSGNLKITGCYSTGNIFNYGGGIAGALTGSASGSVTIDKCFSTGLIGDVTGWAGGIVGNSAGSSSGGSVTITNCFSTGQINDRGGGIAGYSPNNTVSISKCYSTGNITGSYAGGICGQDAQNSVVVTNCYSTGALGTSNANGIQAGGIFGLSFGLTPTAFNCYTSGIKNRVDAGGIYPSPTFNVGITNDNVRGSNNYSEGNGANSGSWSTTNATNYLQNPSTTVWLNPGINQAFLLRAMGYTQYSTTVTTSTDITQTYSKSVQAGTSTDSGISATNTYSTISAPSGFTVNSSSGAVTADSSVVPDVYTVIVVASSTAVTGMYNITIMTITVTAIPVVATTTTTPLIGLTQVENVGFVSYTVTNEVKEGVAILQDKQVNPRMKFASYEMYVKYLQACATRN